MAMNVQVNFSTLYESVILKKTGPEILVLLVQKFSSHHPQDEELPDFVAQK